MEFKQWKGFEKGEWKRQINVRDFIQKNYTPYEGNSSFLKGTTEKTQKLWDEVCASIWPKLTDDRITADVLSSLKDISESV